MCIEYKNNSWWKQNIRIGIGSNAPSPLIEPTVNASISIFLIVKLNIIKHRTPNPNKHQLDITGEGVSATEITNTSVMYRRSVFLRCSFYDTRNN